jgi:hypothetical protein
MASAAGVAGVRATLDLVARALSLLVGLQEADIYFKVPQPDAAPSSYPPPLTELILKLPSGSKIILRETDEARRDMVAPPGCAAEDF